MSLLTLFIVLLCIALVAWAARRFIPDAFIAKLVVIVCVVVAILVVLQAFGLLDTIRGLTVPKV